METNRSRRKRKNLQGKNSKKWRQANYQNNGYKMLKELRERVEELGDNFNSTKKNMETIKKNQSEMKGTLTEMKKIYRKSTVE